MEKAKAKELSIHLDSIQKIEWALNWLRNWNRFTTWQVWFEDIDKFIIPIIETALENKLYKLEELIWKY